MKSATLHSLMTAKSVLNEAKPLVASRNPHSCSAALIMIQDGLELAILACLLELGIDEIKNIESKSFDELIGELKVAGLNVPKSGTIKALNKQRVITKHYGQLAEPATVDNYERAAHIFINESLRQVVGKELPEIMLTDLLPDCGAKRHLVRGIQFKDNEQYLMSLIEVRKAIFTEVEIEYAVHNWSDVNRNEPAYGFLGLGRGGLKAPSWKRNKQWIDEHVQKPTDFIQIDPERLRLDAMEWGVSTAELENLRRLT